MTQFTVNELSIWFFWHPTIFSIQPKIKKYSEFVFQTLWTQINSSNILWIFFHCRTPNESYFSILSQTLVLVSMMDHRILLIVVVWLKYNEFVVKFTTICCRWGWKLNQGPFWTYYCCAQSLWTTWVSPLKVQLSVVY